MKIQKHIITNANEAVARIAYKTNEVCAIYPITPASQMSELVEEWSAKEEKNIFDAVPQVFEMQSEGGVAGAMHGALQTGALSTTFTASQGLLLMLPNMYKIAGELTPNVIHVATRSIATHALSVFGDHSDVMAVRDTGYALLSSSSIQEAMDFALIAQAATLKSRIPFVHFFDGFRTSHETNKIENITDEVIFKMMDDTYIRQHKERALSPDKPVLRGTSQGPDTFFQSREATNSFYTKCAEIVQDEMNAFASLTGRTYNLFEYIGDPNAERIIVSMASSCETVAKTVEHLNRLGEKVGLIKVRLYRPFSEKHFLSALPKTCKSIAVLDRTKEPGSVAEPLYLDVAHTILKAFHSNKISVLPTIAGGRYGLSSKPFSPSMVKAVFDNLDQKHPKNNFTVGITDDLTNLHLECPSSFEVLESQVQALFYQYKNKESELSASNMVHLIGKTNGKFVQSYTECDYKKSNSRSVLNFRFGDHPIKAPYLIQSADTVICDSVDFLIKDNALERTKQGGRLLVITKEGSKDLWTQLPNKVKKEIQEKNISLYHFYQNQSDTSTISKCQLQNAHASFLALYDEVCDGLAPSELKENIQIIDTSDAIDFIEDSPSFANTFLGKLVAGKGNELPTSAFPVDGTYPTDTSKYHQKRYKDELPQWDFDSCTQCGLCSMACPQAAIRIKAYGNGYLENAPSEFKSINSTLFGDGDLLNYTVQVNPEQCTSCNNCVDACPAKALVMKNISEILTTEKQNWDHFETIPEFDNTQLDTSIVAQQQLQEPLFKYALGDDGCGEAPYLKLLSQLLGDRMLVANATGASSIFGGALPTTPWSKNQFGRGPAWSNSLFEDNAEFGLGYRLSLDQKEARARKLLKQLSSELSSELVEGILDATQTTDKEIDEQRKRMGILKDSLQKIQLPKAKQLLAIADDLIKKSVWIVGGDGWAYDIGFGGLDHVMASGRNVNILVLDNEVYSNTGGQMSKSTPMGATAKFAHNGKQKQKKDLGMMMMGYEDAYVASVAIGADPEQTLKAFLEAEAYDGPSLIIAYCHSPAHGIDMKTPRKYYEAAVASGQWLLYRNDPRRYKEGKGPLQLDSKKPSMEIDQYLKMEERFSKIFGVQSELLNNIQEKVDKRQKHFRYVSKKEKTAYQFLNI